MLCRCGSSWTSKECALAEWPVEEDSACLSVKVLLVSTVLALAELLRAPPLPWEVLGICSGRT